MSNLSFEYIKLLSPALDTSNHIRLSSTLADYEFPWLAPAGSRSPDKHKPTNYNFTAILMTLGKTVPEVKVPKGPRLVSPRHSRLVVSRGASVTLNCTVVDAGNTSVSDIHGSVTIV